MRYAIVIEESNARFRAWVPDLPGCIATGATLAEAEASMRIAIRYHLDALKTEGLPVPRPCSRVDYVAVSA
ncbi:MAG: type II toxin-antitoxin system HicB family antitoxin [Lautropia sp.]